MMKIFRLSMFNIKKSKREALAVAFLAFISALFLGIVVTNAGRINTVFHESFARSGSYNTFVLFPADKYREACTKVLWEEYGIENPLQVNQLFLIGSSIKDKKGDKYGVNLILVTPSAEKRIEDFVMDESISEDEIAQLAHPIWLPMYFKLNRGFELSDEFVMVMNGREYPFTIAGFYESGMMAADSTSIKCVVNEEDYRLLEPISNRCVSLYFDYEDFPFLQYAEKCDEYTSENICADLMYGSERIEKNSESQFLDMFLIFVGFFSVITLASAMFLVRHKIGNDIEDQMQQIGVLEALGYKSKEISLSYVLEYLLSGGVGAILGGGVTLMLTPIFSRVISVMLGRTCSGNIQVIPVMLLSLLVIMMIVMFALSKAHSVKKFPPVVAFRKGIRTHHFGKNHLPLDNTKGNINVRIAMKDFLGELKTSFGVCICIIISSLAILFSISAAFFFRNGYHALVACMGTEISEVTVSLENGIDVNRVNEEISQMSEVRKTLLTYGDFTQHVKVMGAHNSGTIVAFEDYSETENIILAEGRFPKYDNEVMISVGWRERENYHVGDSIVMQGDASAKKYVITGVASGMLNGGTGIYLNYEGLQRLNTYATLDTINIYLKDGVDKDEFQKKLAMIYGASTEEATEKSDASENEMLTERIKALAEEKMAILKEQYGVTDIEYAIVIGDEIITGNSKFVIKKISSFLELAKGQTEEIANISKVFTLVSALVVAGIVAVILSIISVSSVRRKKKDIGIMKSLGYSSKDLMTQMAMRIMPPTIVGVGIASVLTYYVYKIFWVSVFAVEMSPVAWVIVATDIVLIAFCYFVTYLSAGRIKEISVTELMTE